jgi:sugar lactone lactonase YvrE
MLSSHPTSLHPGRIGTIAGADEGGYAGDGGPAIAARLNEPKGVSLDHAGGLYIADSENHLIRRVDLARGTISTVAGCPPSGGRVQSAEERAVVPPVPEDEDPLADPPSSGPATFTQLTDLSGTVRFVVGTAPASTRFAGDGGPAMQATLNFPSGVAVGGGALYIADTMNHRIRKVDMATGMISTLAGTGQHRLSGDGGPASAATLNEPCALVLDTHGNLYIADQSNNKVRKVDPSTGVISSVAGTGEAAYGGDGMLAAEAALAGPSGLAIGPEGALYIADTFNGRIRRVDLETGIITTVAGDGGEYRYDGRPNEFSTSLSRPYGIAVDREGNIFITDSDSHLIRRWDCKKKVITVVAGNGLAQFSGDGHAATESSLNYPFGVTLDSQGHIYIADTFNHRVRMVAV